MHKLKETGKTLSVLFLGLLALMILADVAGYTFKLIIGKKSVIRIENDIDGFHLETRPWWFGDRWEIQYLHRPDPENRANFVWMRRTVKKNGELIKRDSHEAGWEYVHYVHDDLPEYGGPFFFRIR